MSRPPLALVIPPVLWARRSRLQRVLVVLGVLLAMWFTSWLFVLAAAAWVALALVTRPQLPRLTRPVWGTALGLGLVVLMEVLAPQPPRVTLPPAVVSPSLMIPGPVLASGQPRSWLAWAVSLPRATDTDAGIVALSQGLLAYPEDPQFALDLAAAYRMLASQTNSLWAYQQVAWYYGVVGGALPPTGPPDQP
jgi:hypothetical protein